MEVESWLKSKGYNPCGLIYCTGTCFVYRGTHPACPVCPEQVAIKVQIFTPGIAFNRSQREINTMGELRNHPNVIQLYEHFSEQIPGKQVLALVMELAQKDLMLDLDQRRKNQYPWEETELMQVARDLVDVLALAERKGICHRDIKPQNIFYNSVTKQVKLGDFGSSAAGIFGIQNATVVGTPLYMSTELKNAMLFENLRIEHDVIKSDVYALGITLLALGKLAVPVKLLISPTESVMQEEIASLTYGERFKYLLFDMTNLDIAQRLTFCQLQNRYFPASNSLPVLPSHLSSSVQLPSALLTYTLPTMSVPVAQMENAPMQLPASQPNPIEARRSISANYWNVEQAQVEQREMEHPGAGYYQDRAEVQPVPSVPPPDLPQYPRRSAPPSQAFYVPQMSPFPQVPPPPSISPHYPLHQLPPILPPQNSSPYPPVRPIAPQPVPYSIHLPICPSCYYQIQDISIFVGCSRCPGANFCSSDHFQSYTIRATNKFARETVPCSNCDTALNSLVVESAIGGSKVLKSLKEKYYKEGLLCTHCHVKEATMVLSCSHIVCEKCMKGRKSDGIYFCGVCNIPVDTPKEMQKTSLLEGIKKLLPW